MMTDKKRRASPEKSNSDRAHSKNSDKISNLPEFLKNVTKPGAVDQSWDD